MLVTLKDYHFKNYNYKYKYTNQDTIGILDFCKQKLTAPPIKPILNLTSEQRAEETTKSVQILNRPPYGRGLMINQ